MEFDAIGLLEVEHSKEAGHHGKNIARHITGVDGEWAANKDVSEDLGVFGKNIHEITVHELVGGRTMIIARVDDVFIGLVHFTFHATSDKLRQEQAAQAINHMAGYDKAVLMGDFNSASWQRSRKIIEKASFSSAFQALGRKRPATIMPEKYRKRMAARLSTTPKFIGMLMEVMAVQCPTLSMALLMDGR